MRVMRLERRLSSELLAARRGLQAVQIFVTIGVRATAVRSRIRRRGAAGETPGQDVQGVDEGEVGVIPIRVRRVQAGRDGA